MNILKIIGHNVIEYSWLGGWYIALEGDPKFWIIGISGAIVIHFIVFNVLDIFHDLHHHHKGLKEGHADHKKDEQKL